MKFKRIGNKDIIIRSSHNEGFIVSVECCTLVYADIDKLVTDLKDYLTNPEDFEKAYAKLQASLPLADGVRFVNTTSEVVV